ncbi:MAG: LVIVD repeat-containing protein [Candidatus Zixiibacteriota bacterium]
MSSKKTFGIILLILGIVVSSFVLSCDDNSTNSNDHDDLPADTTMPDSTGAGIIEPVGELSISRGTRKGMAIKDDNLYICDMYHISVVDISDLASPSQIGRFPESDLTRYATGVAIKDTILGVYSMGSSSDGELNLASISNPTNPRELGSLALPRNNGNLVFKGDYALMPASEQGVFVVDISDPTSPAMHRTINISGSQIISDISIGLDYLFVGIEMIKSIRIYDISDINSEIYMNSASTYGKLEGSFFKYNNLFVANGTWQEPSDDAGFSIFSMEDLNSSIYADTLESTSCQDVYVDAVYAYVVYNDRPGGDGNYLRVYGIYHPESPVLHHQIELSGDSYSVFARDGDVFILCRTKLLTYRHEY